MMRMKACYICIGCAKVIERADTEWHVKQCRNLKLFIGQETTVEHEFVFSTEHLSRRY
jgi:hypothetical protein